MRTLRSGWFWAYATMAALTSPAWIFTLRMIWTALHFVVAASCSELFGEMCR